MENNKEIKTQEKEQLIVLSNRKNLSISGTKKVISLKPDLIQLDTNFGGILVNGTNLELIKLDNSTTRVEILGSIDSIRFVENKSKEPIFRKIFKWYFQHKIRFIAF